MIAEQADSPDKVSVVNKSPTTLTSRWIGNSGTKFTKQAQFDFLVIISQRNTNRGVMFPMLSTTSKSFSDKLDASIGNLKLTGIPSNRLLVDYTIDLVIHYQVKKPTQEDLVF